MRRLVPLVLSCAIVLVACGGGGAGPSPSESTPPSGSLGTVTAEAATRTVAALCDVTDDTDREQANATFYDDAHQELHVIAAATSEVDRAAAAGLLTTMQRVEADLEASSLPDGFAADAEALRTATTDALAAIGVEVPSCST